MGIKIRCYPHDGGLWFYRREHFNMDLKKQTIEELKGVVKKDYGVLLSDSEANEFGSSLLRLTRLTIEVSEKTKEIGQKYSPVNFRIRDVLEPRINKPEGNGMDMLKPCDIV